MKASAAVAAAGIVAGGIVTHAMGAQPRGVPFPAYTHGQRRHWNGKTSRRAK